jgi:hypothetical protein
MDPNDDLDNLREEFVRDVFSHFPPGPEIEKLDSALFGYSAVDIELIPDLQSFVQCFPAYRLPTSYAVHFTSLKALHGILNEYSLRLYSLSNCNDPNEFSHLARHHDDSEHRINLTKDRTYLLSLCELEVLDSPKALDLWRFYGQQGLGVALVLSIEMTSLAGGEFLFGRVHYEDHDYADFKARCKAFGSRHENREVKLRELMALPALLHKHPAYASEKEIRLIRFKGESPKNHLWKLKNTDYQCDFNSRNEIVNYMNLPFESSRYHHPKIKIERIQLGFRHDEKFTSSLSEHITMLMTMAQRKHNHKVNVPAVELSPLRDIYR